MISVIMSNHRDVVTGWLQESGIVMHVAKRTGLVGQVNEERRSAIGEHYSGIPDEVHREFLRPCYAWHQCHKDGGGHPRGNESAGDGRKDGVG